MIARLPLLSILFGSLIASQLHAADPPPKVYATPQEAASDPAFELQGEYISESLAMQVVALGKDEFQAVIYRSGLPGVKYDGKDRQVSTETSESLKELIDDFGLKKIERKSPTLGQRPPDGSIVLFDGTRETFEKHWKPDARMTDDGLLQEGATSIDQFRDFSLHIEFRLPFMPDARGQGRGNSGIYYQGRYETQMLDSFGLEGKNNETGGIYEIRDPNLNMCFPPLAWQTYDADFTAARWDKDGNKTADARLTVRLNGVVVQPDVPLPHITRAAPVPESPEPGPIYLQNHGNPVRYGNIWVLPRDADQEARRPIIPGFERFYGDFASDHLAGGRLLAGELGCVHCHAASQEVQANLQSKQAPILDDISRRVRPEWAYEFIAAPHHVKPGTTMPGLFDGWSDADRDAAVKAVVSFLFSPGGLTEQLSDQSSVDRGQALFHEVGCAVCHAPRDGQTVQSATTVPFPDMAAKYSLPGLVAFLKDPHQARPAGRMPAMHLDDQQARDVASYLLGRLGGRRYPPNLRYKVYQGTWSTLPNFDTLEPISAGECAGLDLSVAGRSDHFGMRFEGFLKIERAGRYRFHLGSDDGSRLLIDGNVAADADGIHPHTTATGRIQLEAGVHSVQIDYFEQGGQESLTLEYEGPQIARQDLSLQLWMSADGNSEPSKENKDVARFAPDPTLIETGRDLFARLGCASCHQLKRDGQAVVSQWKAKSLAELQGTGGCLTIQPSAVAKTQPPIPNFALSPVQRVSLVTALAEGFAATTTGEKKPASEIHDRMVTFNCYACHRRGDVGGPEKDRNELFRTSIPEMGDEGRIPPPLDGVGDKLNDAWLTHVVAEGANDRPYMRTRMPKFGKSNVGELASAFVSLDRRADATIPKFDEPEVRVKSAGRELVGDQALACVKCHTFGKIRATGIQAIDLQTMTKRLREDWFLRYLYNPPEYRPGTRMPTGFPNGQAIVRDIYHGDPAQQIEAIWTYLSDGPKAGIPDGMLFAAIELKPTDRPLIYRNFLDGLSPRGIAVGYPENANLAWDAADLCLKRVWHGKFIDASTHWAGRGQGFQPPLGDHILNVDETVPIAHLSSTNEPWPVKDPLERGYRFRGYQLNGAGRPTFLYDIPGGDVQDSFTPQASAKNEGTFTRTLRISAADSTQDLYFRAATGRTLTSQGDGSYLVDGVLRIRVTGGKPFVRESNGRQELLVPLAFKNGQTEITQELLW